MALCVTAFGLSQTLPIDYEDGTTTATFQFDGALATNIANPDMNNNPSTRVLQVEKGTTTNNGGAAAWFSGFGYNGGAGFIDFANGTTFSIKIWSPRANIPFRARVQQGGSPAYNVDFVVGPAMSWQDITLDFLAANPGITGTESYPEIVIQPNFDPACATQGANCVITNDDVFFFDDIAQVTNNDPATDATLSNLTIDGVTVMGFAPTVSTYVVQFPTGTTTIPSIGATATQAGNGSSSVNITQASGIPGTATVVVTAPDGSTQRTYTVEFVFTTIPPSGIAPQSLSDGINLIVYSDIAPGAGDNTVSNFNLNTFGDGTRSGADLDGDSTDETFRLEDVNFYGAQWDAVDLTTVPYQFVHINYYAESVDEFRFFLIDQSAGIGGGLPEEPRFVVSNTGSGDAALAQGSWQSVFMPLSIFENFNTGTFNYDLTDIFQYKIETTGGIMFFDNIFFSTSSTLSSTSIAVNSLLVTPNPATDFWSFKDVVNNIQEIAVYDMTGKLVLNQTPSSNTSIVNATGLKSGIYLAQVTTDAGRETIKLVKK